MEKRISDQNSYYGWERKFRGYEGENALRQNGFYDVRESSPQYLHGREFSLA